jgi:hypothetical protein
LQLILNPNVPTWIFQACDVMYLSGSFSTP